MEQQFATTQRGLCICHCLNKQLFTYLLLSNGLTLHKLLKLLNILVAIECNTTTFTSIPTGTTCFLIITLKTLGHIIVDNDTHVRLINTHTKGNGSNNHVNLFIQKLILVGCPCCSIHSGMVGQSLYTIHNQKFCKLFNLLPAKAVDYTRLSRILLQHLDNLFRCINLRPYLIVKVGPVEGRLENMGFLNTQCLLYIMLYLGCSSCS